MNTPRLKFRPKYEKIVELLLYLSHKKPGADHYQAVKFLYLADNEHLNRHGRPITFERYCALPYGPVASNALDLLTKSGDKNVLKKFGITELPFETRKLDRIVYIESPKRAVNHDIFSKSDLKVFDDILNQYGDCNFKQLYNITHGHFAYTNAWSHRGDKKSAEIKYEDMINESSNKAAILEEIETISDRMQ